MLSKNSLLQKMLCFLGLHHYHVLESKRLDYPVNRILFWAVAIPSLIFVVTGTLISEDVVGGFLLSALSLMFSYILGLGVGIFYFFLGAISLTARKQYNYWEKSLATNTWLYQDRVCLYCKKRSNPLKKAKEQRERAKQRARADREYKELLVASAVESLTDE